MRQSFPGMDLQPLMQQAIALQAQGRLGEAAEVYETILRSDNRHLQSIYQLACIRLQQNRVIEAEDFFRRAVKIDKKSADAHHYLAIVLTGVGHLEDALVHYRKALELKPRDAVGNNNLGYVLQRLGRNEEAIRHYRKALLINPDYPEALNNLGNTLQLLGRAEQAIKHYRQALVLRPDDAKVHNNLATALAAGRRHHEAIEHCKKALALAPSTAEVHMNFANSLGAIGRPEDALMHYQKAIAIEPLNAEAYARAGIMLFHLGRAQEAITHYEKALTIDSDHVDALGNMGAALRAFGEVDEAIHWFEKAISAAPKRATGFYYNLVNCKTIFESDPHFAAMQRLAGQIESFDVDNQVGLHFALAKALADIGDHRRSFQHLLRGNALKREEFVEYDESKALLSFERVRSAFTPEFFKNKKCVGNPSAVPVFIVGMIRSGTSLVEQILASHPKVFGAGERYECSNLAGEIAGALGAEFPEAVADMSGEQFHAFGTNYVRAMQPLAPDAERIIDKMPGNFIHAGLIHLALPNARIIHTRRDPRDVALSCFGSLFATSHPYAYSLTELGRHIRAYERLMEHWRQVLPEGALLEIEYEELVGNFETEAKRIVAFCGLEWDDACLSFHKTKRLVYTASVTQVRRPIYSSSVGRWRLYEQELEPFLRAYAEA